VATGGSRKKDGWQTMSDGSSNAFKNRGVCGSYFATGEKNLAY
jgi:hypothetical protein